jgi:hypothetical protein
MLKGRRLTVLLACLTLAVLVLSLPGSLRDAFDRGGIAIFLGIRSGLADARMEWPPYLYGILFHRDARRELLRTGFESVVNLILIGILLDSVSQWLIFGVSHPGAALLVGPVLIGLPYAFARALSNRLARRRR